MVRTLQTVWPDTRITWIIGQTEFGLLEGASGIEFITFNKNTLWTSLATLGQQLASRRFSLLLHMQASMRANLVSLLVRADTRLGFDPARARDYQGFFTNEKIAPAPAQHAMDALFGFAEHLGIRQRVMRWDFHLESQDRQRARAVAEGSGPLCVISPCSSTRLRNYRNWSVAHYIDLSRHLLENRGARVVLTGGPTPLEQHYGAAIMAALGPSHPHRLINLIGQTRLKELFAILEIATLVICPDSGPAHLATAAGVPVIGLYATSNPLRTGPYASGHLVVNRYPEALQRALGQAVEQVRWGARVRDPDAMNLIRVEDVLARVDAVLQPHANK